MKEIAPYILGLCLTHAGTDPVMGVTLCRLQWESEQRVIIPSNPKPEIQGFDVLVENVCWPKSSC